MPALAQNFEQDVLAFFLGDHVKRGVERALETERRDALTLDPRVRKVWAGEKSLPEIAEMFRVLNSYMSSTDYS